jgi:ubiquitin conjugation factor E4 B
MNDSMYILFEGLAKISSVIKELQPQLKSSKTGYELSSVNQFRNRPELETLEWVKQQAAAYIFLIDTTVVCLREVTAIVPDVLLSKGVVDRLAQLLNAYQVILTHESCKRLMVQNDVDRQFNPVRLLSGLVDVYSNLQTKKEFVRANACEIYLKGLVNTLKQYGIDRLRDVSGFEKFINTVEMQLRFKDGAGPSNDNSDQLSSINFAFRC